MTTRVFYHGDLDGQCAAAAVKYLIDLDAQFYSSNYNKEMLVDTVQPGDNVWILDFKPRLEDIKTIQDRIGGGNLIWIDHHPVPEELKDINSSIMGVRDTSDAACVLTWKWILNGAKEIPMFVELIGDMDSWHWKYEFNTKSFVAGMGSFPTEPNDYIWRALYENPNLTDNVMSDGRAINRYLSAHNEQRINSWGFIAKIDEIETIVSNDRGGALLFGDKAKEFPMVCTFIHDGENFNVSLYSSQINVRQIAEKYGEQSGLGGGGHDGAAGFRCRELPFTNVCPLSVANLN